MPMISDEKAISEIVLVAKCPPKKPAKVDSTHRTTNNTQSRNFTYRPNLFKPVRKAARPIQAATALAIPLLVYHINRSSILVSLDSSNRGADRRRGPHKQTQFDCAVHGARRSQHRDSRRRSRRERRSHQPEKPKIKLANTKFYSK